jgi:hypothetical protein
MQTLDWLIAGGDLTALGAVGIIATLRVRNTGQYFPSSPHAGRMNRHRFCNRREPDAAPNLG